MWSSDRAGCCVQLSTGNTALDIVLCMLFPLLMTQLAPYWEALKCWASKVCSA